MEELKSRFPEGVEYRIEYDTTVFVEESIASVYHTLIEAFVLVFIVVLVFLQNWRATIIPMIAVPVSLIGTLAVMALFGFSLNNLSLFGLVLAIGIVVDDAIVVVENVERLMATGLSPRDASRKAMDEVTGPVIAISLVLCAVFVPTAFMAGISGQFYKQFALTIAASTVISAFNSLTLSPALCALLLKPHGHGEGEHGEGKQAIAKRCRRWESRSSAAWSPMSFWRARSLICWDWRFMRPKGMAGHGPTAPLWLRVAVFAVGAVAGWLLSRPVNWVLNRFFDGFNWVFDRDDQGLRLVRRSAGADERDRVGGLRRPDVSHLPRLSSRADRFHPGTGQGLSDRQRPASRRSQPGSQRRSWCGSSARSPARPKVSLTRSTWQVTRRFSARTSRNVAGMFVILSPFEERAGKPELACPRGDREAAQEVCRVPRGTSRRLRCSARRRAGQHGRFQAAGPRPPRRGSAGAARRRAELGRRSAANNRGWSACSRPSASHSRSCSSRSIARKSKPKTSRSTKFT